METLMIWVGFAGAWLLFAGPIYQAALELRDEDLEVDRIRAAGAHIQPPTKMSAWWWLLPPIKFYKEFKQRRDYQRRYIKALSHEDVASIASYRSKALAWLMVAFGGFLLASRETYEAVHYEGWDDLMLLGLIAGMVLLSFLNLVAQIKRAEKIANL